MHESRGKANASPSHDRRRSDAPEDGPPTATHGSQTQSPDGAGPAARIRRSQGRSRQRESNLVGLGERAKAQTTGSGEPSSLALPLPDALTAALRVLRQTIINRPLDEAARAVADMLVGALAPAAAQIWIADLAPGLQADSRGGAQSLSPRLRLYATRSSGPGDATPAAPAMSTAGGPVRPDGIVDLVVSTRRPVLLFDAARDPRAHAWIELLTPAASNTDGSSGLVVHSTLCAFPLLVRGQFLGVFACAAGLRLTARHVGTLEELADLLALAADRESLASYSRSQEALAQTVVRNAPVAVAVLTVPDHVFALANPAFAALLGVDDHTGLTGHRAEEITAEWANNLATLLRLDAIYEGGEPQLMVELPIHHGDRGMTYWNVTCSPLAGLTTAIGAVLVAGVDVTRQVVARHRAEDVAEVAQERIGQMIALHATSLDVASQLGADPRDLLTDILRRSVALLSARAGTVYVRDPFYDELEAVVCQGLRGDYVGSRIRVGEGLAGRVALTGQGLIVDDYRAYPFRTAIYDDEDFSAVIAVPLIHRGRVVGVLDVLDDAESRAFTDDDLWLLDLFAAQAAQAIENARTYVELERAYQQQRELDRLKDDFIATASHELRTPLTGVQGFLELLLDYRGSRDEPTALDFLRRASNSAAELGEISERLLQTSRLDTGHLELHIAEVRLAAVVDDAVHALQSLHHVHGQSHDLHCDVPDTVIVRSDRGRLREVLDNLIGNAVKYSPNGGSVTVRCVAVKPGDESLVALLGGQTGSEVAPEVADVESSPSQGGALRRSSWGPVVSGTIDERPTVVLPHLAQSSDPEHAPCSPNPSVLAAAQSQPFVVVYVSDEGMGIGPEERGRLFGRFARLDSARSSQIRGTGLGLYICRQILRAMGGDVWLHSSAPGQGSTFACALPAGRATAHANIEGDDAVLDAQAAQPPVGLAVE